MATEQKGTKRRYTKADYQATAESLAMSGVIRVGISTKIEHWIEYQEESATRFGGDDGYEWLELKLLKDAWARIKAQRIKNGDCVDCGGGRFHFLGCPHHTDALGRR